jgi:hypothetical protein
VISIGYPRWLPPQTDRVFLDRKADSWDRLPDYIRRQLRERRDEIAAVRADIAKRAKVKVMPPVEITGDAWLSRDWEQCVHAGTGVVEVGRAIQFGVKLSGASALLADGFELREILLHGFSHCFWLTHTLSRMARPRKSADPFGSIAGCSTTRTSKRGSSRGPRIGSATTTFSSSSGEPEISSSAAATPS